MSWKVIETDSSKDVVLVTHRCRVCSRLAVTCGSATPEPCVCSPAPQPKKRITKGLRR